MRPLALFVICLSTSALGPLALAEDADPVANHTITLDVATKGLHGPATAPLIAKIDVDQNGKPLGTLTCTLYEKQTPQTVANFIGLARGLRPFRDSKSREWVKRPFYDGLLFYRVIPGFIFMTGDALNNGTGDPGYAFGDEFVAEIKADKPGLLVMNNHGPATNGAQFFITDGDAHWLTGKHTIFGQCDPLPLITQIASVPKGQRDLPVEPVSVKRVTIQRGAATPVESKKRTKAVTKE